MRGLIEQYQLCAARITYLPETEQNIREFWAIKREYARIFKQALDGLYTLRSGGLTELCARALKQGHNKISLADFAFEITPNGENLPTLEELPREVWDGILPVGGKVRYVPDLISRLREHFAGSPEDTFERVKYKHERVCELCDIKIVMAGLPILDAYKAGERFKKSMWLMTIQRIDVPEELRFTPELALAFLVSPSTDYTEGGKAFFLQGAAEVYERCVKRLEPHFAPDKGHTILINKTTINSAWWTADRIKAVRDDLWQSLEEIRDYTHLDIPAFREYLAKDKAKLLRCAKSFRPDALWLPILTKGSASIFVDGADEIEECQLLKRVVNVKPGAVLSGFSTLHYVLKQGEHPSGTHIEYGASLNEGIFQIKLTIFNHRKAKNFAKDILEMNSRSSLLLSLRELYNGSVDIFPTWRGDVVSILINLAVGDDIGG